MTATTHPIMMLLQDYLQFRMKLGGGTGTGDAGGEEEEEEPLQMLETPFTRSLPPAVFSYLSVYKSIPAFLAAVSLDIFDKQTVAGTTIG